MGHPPERREDHPDRHEGSGRVLGIVPDSSRPGWSGRAVLELVEDAAGDRPGSPLVLDLAPGSTDLVFRLGAGGKPGFAELVTGRAELWEVVRRDDDHDVFYLPCGSGIPGRRLAESSPVEVLAERVRSRDRLLVILLDRDAAEANASAGRLDGLVRLGGEAGDDLDVPDDLPVIDYHGRPRAAREPEQVRPDRFRRRARSRSAAPRVAIGVVLTAGAAALAVTAGALPVGGSGSADDVDASPAVRTPEAVRSPVERAGLPGLPATSGPVNPRPLSVDLEVVVSSPAGEEPAGGGAISPGAGRSGGQREVAVRARSSPASRAGPVSRSVSHRERAFHATADSLAGSIDFYYDQVRRFRDGLIGCPALIRARERVSELFLRLALHRATLGRELDPAARSRFRNRSRDMEAIDRSFRQNGC